MRKDLFMQNTAEPLSMRLLQNLEPLAQLRLGLIAAEWAAHYWQRAFPETESQKPMQAALNLLRNFIETGEIPDNAHEIAILAYKCVQECDLPHGDIVRSSGFAVAHVAMTPWFFKVGKLARLKHAVMVSINYAEAVSTWADEQEEFCICTGCFLGPNDAGRRPLNQTLGIMREQIRAELEFIEPFDDIERAHLDDALTWVNSGAQLYRLEKPANPPKHLVSYFAIVDDQNILLVDHKQAQLWLPAGGHVEPGEHPRTTVERELLEELGFPVPYPVEPPAMVTCTGTVGLTAGHIDVSLWYVVRASRHQPIKFDQSEFNAVRWFPFSEVLLERTDPHMARFLAKIRGNSSLERTSSGVLCTPPAAASVKH